MTHAIFNHQQQSKLKRFKKFVFVSSNAVDSASNLTEQLHLNSNNSFLSQAQTGSSIVIEKIYASPSILRQLNNLGLKSGKISQVISKTSNGSVVLDLKNSSIGIGTEIAQQIVVTATNEIL